jgi:outer membrane protein assembly factor BamD
LYECSEKVHEAIEKYKKKRYSSAQFLLTDVIAKCPGHGSTDTALFYLGKSWLGMKKPDEAKLEFDRLIQSFSQSPFNEEANYLLGYSSYKASSPWYLDQTSTKDALKKLKEFMETFPQSPFADSAKACIDSCNEKLARKEYEAAVFYEKVAQFDAAIVYLKNVVETYPESRLVPRAKLSMAADLIETKRPAEADAVLEELLDQNHDEAIAKKARTLKLRAQKKP